MLITIEHLRQHGSKYHEFACTRNWFTKRGLEWRKFLKDGYDHIELLEVVGPNDPELNALLKFHGLIEDV